MSNNENKIESEKMEKETTMSIQNEQIDIDSEEISISQLELMANKKKISKRSDEISVSELMSVESKKSKSVKTRKNTKTKTRDDSTLSSESIDEYKKRERERTVKKENNDEYIRKEKSEFLYKFNKMNATGKWSSLRLDMNSSLDEIKNEYERVKNEIQNERSVAFLKRMMLLGVQGMEMLNNKFDPLGVDLDGWSEAMGYSMENQEYDEVLSELYEKYKGRGQMSPEVKLMFMVISSATMFTVSKKIAKLDSNNAIKSLLGNFMNNQHNQKPVQQQQPQQSQPVYKPTSHNIPGVPMTPMDMPGVYYNSNDQDNSSDDGPSKLNGPSNLNMNDEIQLQNIIEKMNERKQHEHLLQNLSENENTEDILRNIPINGNKRGRGRPKKNNVSVNRS
jgi:hypothetical protein